MYMCSCAHRHVGDHTKTAESESLNAKECEQSLPNRAQERWLNLFGRDLSRNSETDAFTRLAMTSSYYR